MAEPSILDARLAEIDRRLRMIQSGLEPVPDPDSGARTAVRGEREPVAEPPAPPAVLHAAPPPARPGATASQPPPPAPAATAEPATVTTELSELATRLRELTASQERLLAATQDLLVEHADVLSRVAPILGVTAGPFADTATLREFEQVLVALPRVREVTVREYAGAERAVLDVHLWPTTS